MPFACPDCRHENPETAHFFNACGHPLVRWRAVVAVASGDLARARDLYREMGAAPNAERVTRLLSV